MLNIQKFFLEFFSEDQKNKNVYDIGKNFVVFIVVKIIVINNIVDFFSQLYDKLDFLINKMLFKILEIIF